MALPALRPKTARPCVAPRTADLRALRSEVHRCLPAWEQARQKRCSYGTYSAHVSANNHTSRLRDSSMGESVQEIPLVVVPPKFRLGSEDVTLRAGRTEPRCHRRIRPSTGPTLHRCTRQALHHLLRFPGVEPPRLVVRWIVESICDAARQRRNLACGSHQLENLRRRRNQQRIRPTHYPLRVIPEDVECFLHPWSVECFVSALQDSLQIDRGCLRRRIRALPRDRVVGRHHVAHPQGQATAGKLAYRLAYRWRKSSHHSPGVIRHFHVLATLRLQRYEILQDPFALGQVFLRRLHVVPAIHLPSRNALAYHDLPRARL